MCEGFIYMRVLYNQPDDHTASLPQEFTETRQQITSWVDRIVERNDRLTKMYQDRTNPNPDATCFAYVVRVINHSLNMWQTPSSADRLEKLDYAVSEEEHNKKLL